MEIDTLVAFIEETRACVKRSNSWPGKVNKNQFVRHLR